METTTTVPHVLVSGKVHPDGMALLDSGAGFTHELIEDDAALLAERLPDADALVLRLAKVTAAMVDAAPRLRAISRHGVGCDNVPVAHLTAKGIPVLTTGTANSAAVAEHALGLMFACARALTAADRAVHGGDWQARAQLDIVELAGRRLLVVGFGRIGRLVAAKAAALGLAVSVHDPYVSAAACAAAGVTHAPDLAAALPAADILSLHLPSTGAAVIGAAELAALPPGAILVNVARGDLVDEAALAAALGSGHLRAAGLDVFATEPPPPDNPLLGRPDVILSPHNAALTGESRRRMGLACVQNALDALVGKYEPSMVFNPGWQENSAR